MSAPAQTGNIYARVKVESRKMLKHTLSWNVQKLSSYVNVFVEIKFYIFTVAENELNLVINDISLKKLGLKKDD